MPVKDSNCLDPWPQLLNILTPLSIRRVIFTHLLLSFPDTRLPFAHSLSPLTRPYSSTPLFFKTYSLTLNPCKYPDYKSRYNEKQISVVSFAHSQQSAGRFEQERKGNGYNARTQFKHPAPTPSPRFHISSTIQLPRYKGVSERRDRATQRRDLVTLHTKIRPQHRHKSCFSAHGQRPTSSLQPHRYPQSHSRLHPFPLALNAPDTLTLVRSQNRGDQGRA